MKHFVLILMLFSLPAFSHEAEDHPEYLKHSCNIDAALYTTPDYDNFEKELHHYLDQDCDFFLQEHPYYLSSRMEIILQQASAYLYTSVVKRLINEFHMDINAPLRYYYDITAPPIHIAIEGFHSEANYPYRKKDHEKAFEFFEYILKAGADANWEHPSYYDTILIYAIKSSGNRSLDLIKLLIEYGARLDVEDRDNLTAKEYLGFYPSIEYDPEWQSPSSPNLFL